jgi:hypothetical protein
MSALSAQARTTSLLQSAESGAGETLHRLVPLLYRAWLNLWGAARE